MKDLKSKIKNVTSKEDHHKNNSKKKYCSKLPLKTAKPNI